jgi:pimeloyl-ACP methyl ester carboxylesterase
MSRAAREWTLYKSEESRDRLLEAYEGALARWSDVTGTELARIRIPTGAGETAVFAFGPADSDQPPLLLLHGTLSNSSMWMSDAALLSRACRVFAIDIPGEPGLSEERRLPWEPEIAACWLAQVIAGLGLRRFVLLGLSIGAWISLAYASSRPEGLQALALLCPSGIGRTRSSFLFKAMIAGLRGHRGLAELSRSLYGDLVPPSGALEAGEMLSRSTNPRMETPRIYSDEELSRIAAPIFLAVGTKNSLLRSEETAARLGRLQPEAEILILEGAGHALLGLGGRVADFFERHA